MVTWLIGRSGVGKTTRLLELLPRLQAEYESVYLLVPEQSSMALERRVAAEAPGVQVASFRRLCNVIFRRFGGVAGDYMSRTRELALIYRVLLERRAELRYYRTARLSPGFVTRLRDTFAELTLSGLQEEQVLPLIARRARRDWEEKYHDLFLLYRAYTAALNEECRSAAADISAATALAEEKGFFRHAAVLIDGFFGFTGSQRALLGTIFAQSPAVWCAFQRDPRGGQALFRPAEAEQAQLEALAARAGAQTRVEAIEGPSHRLQNEALRFLERNFFLPAAAEPCPDMAPVRLIEARNAREELTVAAAEIARAVREEGLRYRDFALIAGSLDHYGPMAAGIFRKFGVPLFVDQGRASTVAPLFAFVRSALRMISGDRFFRQEDVLTFLKTGLCGEDPDLIGKLEHYCVRWQLNGNAWIGDREWTKNPAGLGALTDEGKEELAALNGLRARIRAPLLQFRARAQAGTGRALAEAIFELTEAFGVPGRIAEEAERLLLRAREEPAEAQALRRRSREYMSLYAVFTDILDDLYLVLGTRRMALSEMEELIGLCGEEAALNVVPPTADAVTFGAVAHSRLEGVRRLYVVGANQGVLPMPAASSGLIGDAERELFHSNSLPCNATPEQNIAQGRARFYAALFSASECVTFSYALFDLRGEALVPSPYIRRLRAQTGLAPLHFCDFCPYDLAVTPEGARELMGVQPAWRDDILRELGEAPAPPPAQDDRIPQEVVRRIFGTHLRLSYSQIGEFQKCPFHYFLNRTLRIRPVEPVRFDALNIGNFVHYGMEVLVNRLKDEGFPYARWTRAALTRFSGELAERYLTENLCDLDRTPRFLHLYRRMTALLARVAENTLGELSGGRYVPYAAEQRFSVRLPLSEERVAELVGSVDRVDVYQAPAGAYLKVTDYKTGGQSFRLDAVTNRCGVQLPIYLYALEKSGLWEKPVPAAACYMNALTPQFSGVVPPEELEARIRDFYRRTGAFTADQAALDGLDAHRGADYFKIKYNQSGALHGSTVVYEPALMQEMADHMERVVTDTAEALLRGEAAARPLKGNPDYDPCRYCEFKQTCRRREGDPARLYDKDPEGWRKEAAE